MKRGFFRLWVILTVVWIAGGAWLFWDDLTGKLRPEEVAANVAANVPEGYILTPILENVHERCRSALELLLLPPLGLLALGCAGFWVVRGFQS